MKYVIRYASPVNEGITPQWLPYLYHEKCFVRDPGSEIDGTQSQKLSEAEFFDTYQDAEHIVEMVYSEITNASKKYPQQLKIIKVTEKEIFKAKLAGK